MNPRSLPTVESEIYQRELGLCRTLVYVDGRNVQNLGWHGSCFEMALELAESCLLGRHVLLTGIDDGGSSHAKILLSQSCTGLLRRDKIDKNKSMSCLFDEYRGSVLDYT